MYYDNSEVEMGQISYTVQPMKINFHQKSSTLKIYIKKIVQKLCTVVSLGGLQPPPPPWKMGENAKKEEKKGAN